MFVPARVALVFSLLATTLAQDGPVVEVEGGSIVGVTETFEESEFINVTKNVDVFKGIPFAEPPVGQRRFAPLEPKQAWSGNWNATYFRDPCVQDPSGVFGRPTSEDCMYLNVYAPNPKPVGATVMVWIHGGGLAYGSAALPDFQGNALVATGDVIVVGFNYRLNIFGFLTTGDEAAPGNLGLKDQVFALQWIKRNIESFGGDPERITLFGVSAGATSISWHLLSEQSAELFNYAILESGTALNPTGFSDDKETFRRQAFQIGEKLGCDGTDSTALLNCLREKSSTDLFLASVQVGFIPYAVVDGTFVEDSPANLYATGRYKHANILLGTAADEGTLFILVNPLYFDYTFKKTGPFISREVFDQQLPKDVSTYFGGPNEQLVNAIKMRYIDWSLADYNDTDYFRAYDEFATDAQFACPTNKVARYHAQGGDDVYLYEMTLVPSISYYNTTGPGPGWLGAAHGEDIPFVFGIPFMEYAASYPSLLDEEKALSVKVMKYWTEFAKTGNPNSQPESDPEFWPRFTIPELKYKQLDLNLTTSRALKSDVCQFWNSYVPQLRTALGELEAVERDWRQSFSTWKYTDIPDWRDQFNRYKAATGN